MMELAAVLWSLDQALPGGLVPWALGLLGVLAAVAALIHAAISSGSLA